MQPAPAQPPGALEAALARLGPWADAGSRRALAAISSPLVAACEAFGFERRLGRPGRGVDFGLRLEPVTAVRGLFAAGAGTPRGIDPDAWALVGAALRRWCQDTAGAQQRSLFLELDTSRPADGLRVPSFFLRALGRGDGSDVARAAGSVWARVRGRPLEAGPRTLLASCFDALPATGSVLDLGWMLGRGEDRLRLHASLPVDGVDGYLDALGFVCERSELRETIERFGVDRFGALLDGVELQLDLGAAQPARIGVEYGFPRHGAADRVAEWAALLARLEAVGLCEAEERGGLLAWPGRLVPGCEAGLSHVKLVLQPGLPLAAKAYLYVERSRPLRA